VADRAALTRRPLVGRAGEIDAVVGLVDAAVRGEGGALLVSGEAGVGKTALVLEASERVGNVAAVLWASCLPLTSLAVPFLPLASALRGWAADRDVPVPVLGGSAEDGPAGFDAWLDALCRQGVVLLVVDDLQWADQSSLDVLMYVLAGMAGRRLAVITTVRTGEESQSLRRWLADVRRLPGVAELRLGRLDRVATGEQLAGLLGRPPHQSLVDDVCARTRGNAYLNTLLVRGLSPDVRSLPAGLPTDLREAVIRTWRGLSTPAQELTRLVAVAGRPQRADQLDEVTAATGVSGDVVVPLLREAVDAAVLEVGADGMYWFVHPLLAEALEQELLPEERATLHAVFAAALEASGDAGQLGVERVVDLADHHYRARHQQEAYRWALLGADAAGRAGGATEVVRLLRRALQLWPHVSEPEFSRIDLLRRIKAAAEQTGEPEHELAAVDDLLALVDQKAQPLFTAELLIRRDRLEGWTGREQTNLDDVREAVRLSAEYPESAEHALAVAALAGEELWSGEPSGPARVDAAVRMARACGSAKALAHALNAKMVARVLAGGGGCQAEAEEAQTAAATAMDFMEFTSAAAWAANCLDISSANRDVTERLRRGREELTSLGAPHCYVAKLSADEAFGLVQLGDWRACVERLRVALGSTPGPKADMIARLTAALLAVRQGRLSEAEAHLARAEELSGDNTLLFYGFNALRAELALATGDTSRAFAAALVGVEYAGHANFVERLLPLGARALADEAQEIRDRGEDPAPAMMRLDDLRSRYPVVLSETGPGPMYQVQVQAMQAWYDAEVQRGQNGPMAATAWHHAAQAFAEGQLAWDEAYAWWRAAEALAKDRTTRDDAAKALRRAHRLAVDLQAAPLLAEIDALALSARVSLAAIDERPPPETEALPGLTPREREILAHIVAGRTYGEIARELVLSEKTVSVHVSHLLHKTGTANRVELAQLARRVASSAAG
jgi:DNA-binding CsgD family transcriptional regulator/tetratricopeptide (TPR) repeat protein